MRLKNFLAAIILMATSTVISAQNETKQSESQPQRSCFVDKNKNGVCDNSEGKACKVENGKGTQNCCGKSKGRQCCKQTKCSKSESRKSNNDCCTKFIDKNNNGVCDHLEKNQNGK